MEVELTASTQEISQLRSQVSMLESELAARESNSGSSSTAQMAELIALRRDVQLKEQELSELRLQLESALRMSSEVNPNHHTCMQIYHILMMTTSESSNQLVEEMYNCIGLLTKCKNRPKCVSSIRASVLVEVIVTNCNQAAFMPPCIIVHVGACQV